MAVAVRGVGDAATGADAVTPTLTGSVGDLAIMAIESAAGETASMAAPGKWTAAPNSPVAGADSQLTLYYRQFVTGDFGLTGGTQSNGGAAFRQVATDGTRWVALGLSGYLYTTTESDPSGTWTRNTQFLSASLEAVAYANGYWVAVSSGTSYYASDPAGTWTSNNNEGALDVAYGNGYWVKPRGNGTIRYVAVAANAAPSGTWTSKTIDASATTGILALKYGSDGYWVATGYAGKLYYATDPTGTWTLVNLSSTANLGAVAHGNGYWVVVGDSGKMWYATNPSGTWTEGTLSVGTSNMNYVAYANGYWVAVGNGAAFSYASDPTATWTGSTGASTTWWVGEAHGVAYGSGYWVVVGQYGQIAYLSVASNTAPSSTFTADYNMNAPINRTVLDPGDHAVARMISFSGVDVTRGPFDVTTNGTGASSTLVSFPALTTTLSGEMIFGVVTNATDVASSTYFTSWTNANLGSVTERFDNMAANGNGGGFGAFTGTAANIGDIGATTATMTGASTKAYWIGAIMATDSAASVAFSGWGIPV